MSADSKAAVPHWPQTLLDLRDVLVALFVRRGSTADEAHDCAGACVMELAQYMGGRALYLPMGTRARLALRDAEIFRRANGRNTDALAQEFGLTQRHVQRVMAEQTRLRRQELRGSK